MLGEKIGDSKGKITNQRVVTAEGGPKIETSFRDEGTILGVRARTIGTYWAEMRASGTLYGEGQGVVTNENGEMATWKGQGVGVLQPDGSVRYRGALFFHTQSGKWTRLNKVAAVFEFDVDKDGNTKATMSEWS